MDVERGASEADPFAPSGAGRTNRRLFGDAALTTALLLMISAAVDPQEPGLSQLRRLVVLMNQFPDTAGDAAASMLRGVYQVVSELRQVID